MELLLLCFVMGGVVAVIANSKGFDTFGWLIYGALIWPIALAHVIVKPAIDVAPAPVANGVEKKCPDCAESIKADAKVCRFCGNRTFAEVVPTPSGQQAEEDDWFATFDLSPPPPAPQATTWQKLWWNPHAQNKRR